MLLPTAKTDILTKFVQHVRLVRTSCGWTTHHCRLTISFLPAIIVTRVRRVITTGADLCASCSGNGARVLCLMAGNEVSGSTVLSSRSMVMVVTTKLVLLREVRGCSALA